MEARTWRAALVCTTVVFLGCDDEPVGSCGSNSECDEACIRSACSSFSPVGGPCDEDADCQGTATCSGDRCVSSCMTNADCSEVCVDGRCESARGAGESCDESEDCVSGYGCDTDGTCAGETGATCSSNEDCLERCVLGSCGQPSGPGGPCDEDADCGSGDCRLQVCMSGGWVGLGGSEFGPRNQHLRWSSASGGGVSNTGGTITSVAVAVGISDEPFVAWTSDLTGNDEIYLTRFDGTLWTELGGSGTGPGLSNTPGTSTAPVVVANAAGQPIVAWEDDSHGNCEIYVRFFDGAGWQELGGGSATAGGISNTLADSKSPTMTPGSAGRPILAWAESGEIYLLHWDGAAWQEVGPNSASAGGVSNDASFSVSPTVALDGQGRPVLAWAGGNSEILVRRYDGVAWQEVGPGSASSTGISGTSGVSIQPSIAIDPVTDEPIVAWQDRTDGNDQIYVRGFDGTTWQELGVESASGGGISNTAVHSKEPTITIDPTGRPVVVWEDTVGGRVIYTRRFDGAAWQEVNTGSATGDGIGSSLGNASSPAATSDSQGRVVAGWNQANILGGQVYLRRFEAGEWEQVGSPNGASGGLSDPVGSAAWSSIAISASSRLFAAWGQEDAGVYLKAFDGRGWVEVGQSSASGAGIEASDSARPVMTLNASGLPIVVWAESYSIQATSFDGSEWQPLGINGRVSVSSSNLSSGPAVATDSAGTPVVAWRTTVPGQSQIYVRRFDGSEWQELGAGSATGGGVSDTTGSVGLPALVIDGQDRPVLVWSEAAPPTFAAQLFARRFDGSTWEPVGVGAASGGGITNTPTYSDQCALATLQGNPVVVWREEEAGGTQIHARVFDGTSWNELGGSASEGGISATAGNSETPVIATANGQPIVAWTDTTSSNAEIYVRRFDGQSWVELEASASGGGVSNSGATSRYPTISASQDAVCVAYAELGAADSVILLRCYPL
ncbi:hypothetical protein ACFL6C_10730 [Myxococcota bacterium]